MTAPGVYKGLPMAEYLAIPAVSGGLLETLLTRCAKAAWHESWLNPNREPENSEEMDIGTVAHSMLLEGGVGALEVIDPVMYPTKSSGNIPDGWTNKDIREARDRAREAGRIPILKPKFAPIEAMFNASRQYIPESAVARMFEQGDSELTLVWEDVTGVLCKARCDRIDAARTIICNYKTTKGSVEPDKWARGPLLQYYVGGAFYVRGAYACFGKEPDHVFLCQETVAPHLCSLIGMGPGWLELGNQKVKRALGIWRQCVATGHWPGYPTAIAYPEMPPWEEIRFVEKQIADGIDYGSQP